MDAEQRRRHKDTDDDCSRTQPLLVGDLPVAGPINSASSSSIVSDESSDTVSVDQAGPPLSDRSGRHILSDIEMCLAIEEEEEMLQLMHGRAQRRYSPEASSSSSSLTEPYAPQRGLALPNDFEGTHYSTHPHSGITDLELCLQLEAAEGSGGFEL